MKKGLINKLIMPAVLLVSLSACSANLAQVRGLNEQPTRLEQAERDPYRTVKGFDEMYVNQISGLNGQSTRAEQAERDPYRTVKGFDGIKIY